jgi:hypothetical protein
MSARLPALLAALSSPALLAQSTLGFLKASLIACFEEAELDLTKEAARAALEIDEIWGSSTHRVEER